MLISKFNKMIRSKLLWGFFAIIICIAFVGGSISSRGCGRAVDATIAGTVAGEDVTYDQFRRARAYQFGFRNPARLSDSEEAELDTATWTRIASLKYAETLGVTSTRQEIDAILLADPRFKVNGEFDPIQYRRVIAQDPGVSAEMFEDYMSQEIALRKLEMLIGNVVLAPPAEMSQKLKRLTDKVEVGYAFLTNDIDTANIDMPEDKARKVFEENKEMFRIPEKMSAQYVVFPIANFTAEAVVTDADALDHYNVNISDYSSRNTNGELETVAFTNARDEIVSALVWEKATELANDMAIEFASDAMPKRDGSVTPLSDILESYSLSTQTAPDFSEYDEIPGIDAGYRFNEAAFGLIPGDPLDSVSDPVMGSSNVYVIIPGDRTPSRLPEFEEKRDDAIPFAQQREAFNLFEKKAQRVRQETQAAIAKGGSFAEHLAKFDIEALNTGTFSALSGMSNDVEYADAIIETSIGLDAGEVSELIPSIQGYALIHVKTREAGDLLEGELMRPQLASAISGYRASLVFEDLQKTLLESTVVRNDLVPAEDDLPEE